MRTRSWVSGCRLHPLAKNSWLYLLLPSVLVLFGAGCNRARPASGITVTHQIKPQPVRVGPAEVNLTLADAAGKPITNAHVGMEADMAHPGMAPVFSDAPETAPGRYQGTVNLNMGGDWVVLLHITLPDGTKVERQLEVNGVESH